ncbi:cation:proton antiporter subunit C [Sphaerospermopsis aphanizomenoides BCCUSP55]|uniref:cation:proton antiporter subunit C n=1 Tax=Sphaerospermopsis aphanizomenoides TaxID=459663 RepID=UPI000B00AFBF|nr:cation:proton antiporter subunit C [Sphaerospermopsis aphanizomenoides]MBK1986484.1 cation:proton antiporter subunit C [Sphaerospermopsis aphanizomenoides BCCUSP55]
MLEACVLATILCGFFGIILKKNLVMKIVSMDVMSTGVIAFYVFIASREGLFTPILDEVKKPIYADPVPQAVILTAIVIGFSIQALMLVGVMKLARDNPTLESNEIEKNNTP